MVVNVVRHRVADAVDFMDKRLCACPKIVNRQNKFF